jgi:predicted transcriptional regulator
MIREVVSASPDLAVSQLLSDYFLRYGYHGFPVRQNGHIAGLISLEEVRKVPETARATTTVAQVMRPLSQSTTISPQASLTEALSKMSREGIGRLLVVQDATVRGMITKTGLLRFLELRQILGPTNDMSASRSNG